MRTATVNNSTMKYKVGLGLYTFSDKEGSEVTSDVSVCCTEMPRWNGPGSIPGLVKWNLWWTKWRRGRFSPSTSVSPAIHSTKFSILTITRGRYSRPVSGRRAGWTQFGLHPPLCSVLSWLWRARLSFGTATSYRALTRLLNLCHIAGHERTSSLCFNV
jgi:hypothetical protein